MRHLFLSCILLLTSYSLSLSVFAGSSINVSTNANTNHSPQKKVLLIISSEGRDEGKTRPGFEMDELSQMYVVLKENDVLVDIASPIGGGVVADKFDTKADHIVAFTSDPLAQAALASTKRIQDVKVGEYDAIMLIGGKGAMFDLPKDPALQKLIAAQYEGGGIVGAVCHGPAVFANVRLSNGKPFVQDRRLTGFTNEEESIFGKKWLKEFPFLIETKFVEQGAKWEEAPLMMPKVVVDGRLITGQNPFSTTLAAEAMVKVMGKTPVKRKHFIEERSMDLVSLWLNGDKKTVADLLKKDKARYKTELIAMLGYYQFLSTNDNLIREQALSIMEMAHPHFPNPELTIGIANAHHSLGRTSLARAILTDLVKEKPELKAAKTALDKLPAE